MTLTDDDYQRLAEQCADKHSGCIEKDEGSIYVDMDIKIKYDPLEEELSGGHIPIAVECYIIKVDVYTSDGTKVDVDREKIEELTCNIFKS